MKMAASGKGSAPGRAGVRQTGVCRHRSWTASSVRSGCPSLPSSTLGGSVPKGVRMRRRPFRNDRRTRGLGCSPFQARNRNMPSRLTLAQIEDMLARDEAQLEAYRYAAVEAAADGFGPAPRLRLGQVRGGADRSAPPGASRAARAPTSRTAGPTAWRRVSRVRLAPLAKGRREGGPVPVHVRLKRPSCAQLTLAHAAPRPKHAFDHGVQIICCRDVRASPAPAAGRPPQTERSPMLRSRWLPGTSGPRAG